MRLIVCDFLSRPDHIACNASVDSNNALRGHSTVPRDPIVAPGTVEGCLPFVASLFGNSVNHHTAPLRAHDFVSSSPRALRASPVRSPSFSMARACTLAQCRRPSRGACASSDPRPSTSAHTSAGPEGVFLFESGRTSWWPWGSSLSTWQ